MDGKNVDTVLTELGVRFHRLIHEHLQQYSYSSMGGMLAICDVAEYRRCAKDFRVSGGGIGPGYTGHRAKHGSFNKDSAYVCRTPWNLHIFTFFYVYMIDNVLLDCIQINAGIEKVCFPIYPMLDTSISYVLQLKFTSVTIHFSQSRFFFFHLYPSS